MRACRREYKRTVSPTATCWTGATAGGEPLVSRQLGAREPRWPALQHRARWSLSHSSSSWLRPTYSLRSTPSTAWRAPPPPTSRSIVRRGQGAFLRLVAAVLCSLANKQWHLTPLAMIAADRGSILLRTRLVHRRARQARRTSPVSHGGSIRSESPRTSTPDCRAPKAHRLRRGEVNGEVAQCFDQADTSKTW